MASNSYNVNLKFTADTNDAKRQIQSLQQALQNVAKMPMGKDELFDDAALNRASQAALELQQHLAKAVNVNTGKLDLSRFSTSLKASNKDLTTYCNTLLATGEQGQQAFLQLATAISTADAPVTRVNAKLREMGTVIENTAKWQISSSIIHGFMGSIQSAYGYAEDLNESLNNIRIVTGQNIEQMDKFAEKANKAAKALSATTLDYTNASLIYYQQGLTDQEVADRTAVTIKMANAAGVSAETVSDQLTAVWNNFYDGSKSLEYYADVMTALGAATASSTDEIAEGLEKFASVAETVGLSYEYATAALATVTATTRQSADVVGTAFKTLFARLQDLELGDTLDDGTTLGQYSEALAKVGVNIKDTNGEMKDMDDILDELGAKWDTLSKSTQVALAQTVAGTRQYTQLVSLMDKWSYFQENLGVASSSSGTLQEQADIYAESWEAARDRVTAAAESIYTDLVNDESFIGLLNGVEKALEGVKGLVEGLGGMKGILTTVSGIFMTVFAKNMPEVLNNLKQNIMVLTGQADKMMVSTMDEMQKKLKIENIDTYDLEYKTQTEGLIRVNAMKKELILASNKLTKQEQLEYQMRIESIQAIYQQAEGLAKLANQAKENANNTKAKATSDFGKDILQATRYVRNYNELEQKAYSAYATDEDKNKWMDAEEGVEAYQNRLTQLKQTLISMSDNKDQVDMISQNFKVLTDPSSTSQSQIQAYTQLKNIIDSTVNSLARYSEECIIIEQENTAIHSQANHWDEVASSINKLAPGSEEAIKRTENMRTAMMSYSEKLKETLDTTEHMSTSNEQVAAAFAKLDSVLKNSKASSQEMAAAFREFNNEIEMASHGEITTLEQKIANVTKQLNAAGIDNNIINSIIKDSENSAKALERLNSILEKIRKNTEEPPKHSVGLSETFTSIAGSIMTLYSAINSIKNAINTLQDPDASGWERFGATVQALLPIIMAWNSFQKASNKLNLMVATSTDVVTAAKSRYTKQLQQELIAEINATAAKKTSKELTDEELVSTVIAFAIKQKLVEEKNKEAIVETLLTKLKSANTAEEKKQIIVETLGIATKQKSTLFTKLNTAAIWDNIKALIVQNAKLLIIIAAAAAAYGIYKGAVALAQKMEDAYNADAIAAKKASSAADSLTSAYSDIKTEYEDMLDTMEQYQTAVDGLEELTIGTTEYAKALNEANDYALKLIKSAGLLSGTDYTVENGVITITDTALKDAEEQMSQKVISAGVTADIAEANANYLAAINAQTQLVQANDSSGDVAAWTTAAASAGAGAWGGAKAGMAVGSAFTPVGTIVGGIAGAIVGAIGGGALGYLGAKEANYLINETENKAELKKIDELTLAYKKMGSAAFTAENLAELGFEDATDSYIESIQNTVKVLVEAESQLTTVSTALAASVLQNDTNYQNSDNKDAFSTIAGYVYGDTAADTESHLSKLQGSKDARADAMALFAAEYELDKLNGYSVDENNSDKIKYSYVDENGDEQEKVVTVEQLAAFLASKEYQETLSTNSGTIADLMSHYTDDEIELLNSFLKGSYSNLSVSQRLNATSFNMSQEDLDFLGITQDALDNWVNAASDALKKWKNNSWFKELTEEEQQLVLQYDLDPNADEEALQEELKRLQQMLAEHPLEAQIGFANSAESAIKNGKWSDLKTAMKNMGLTDDDYLEVLGQKNQQAMLDKFRELSNNVIDTTYANTTTPEQAKKNKENAQEQVNAAQENKDNADTAVKEAEEDLGEANYLLDKEKANNSYYQYASLADPNNNYDTQTRENFLQNFADDYATQYAEANNIPVDDYLKNEFYYKLNNYLLEYDPNKDGDIGEFLESRGFDHISSIRNNSLMTQAESRVEEANNKHSAATDIQTTAGTDLDNANTALDNFTKQYESALIDVANKELERTSRIENAGLDEDTVEAYRDMLEAGQGLEGEGASLLGEWLEDLSKLSELKAEQALDDLSITTARLTKGLKALGTNWSDWNKIMSSSTATIDQIAEILPDINDSIADILDWDLSDIQNLGADFYKDNWSLIQDVYNGVDGAIEKLAGLATKKVQLDVITRPDEESLAQAYDSIAAYLSDMPDLEVGMALEDQPIYDALTALLANGAITVDQMNAILSGIGFTPTIEPVTYTVEQLRAPAYADKKITIIDPVTGESQVVKATDYTEKMDSEEKITVVGIGGKPQIQGTSVYTGGGGIKAQAPSASSGGGGGSKPKKVDLTKKSDVVDRYKEINDSIEDNSQAMNKASKAADRLYGEARLKRMKEVNNLIQKEISLNKQKREEALEYLAIDKADLADAAAAAGISFTFDEDGDITNYTEQMTKLWEELHAAQVAANADGNADEDEQEAIQKIQDKIDAVSEAIDQYEETKSLIEDLDDEIQEQIYEWQDNNLEMLSMEIELKIEVNDDKLEWIEYLLKKTEGDVYKVAEAFGYMNEKIGLTEQNLQTYYDGAEEVFTKFNSIDPETGLAYYSQEGALEKLKEYRSNIINELSDMLDLDADMLAYYGDVLDLVTEEIEKQTSKFDDLNTTLDHYNTLLELTGQSKNYKAMNEILSAQADIAKNQAAIAKRQYETYADEVEDWKAKMEAAQAAGDEAAYELYEQNYEAAYEKMVEAQDEMYSKTEEWLEDMKALYENKLADLGEQLEEALTGGISFDELTTAMERSSSLQEEYLTTTNQIYETNKLMRQAQQEIDKTTNSVAKKKLAAYIQETEQLQNQGKLSNYELEIQQAKYDLLLAEIALEEAQQAKSTVRLQRDSEGNLGYVYTADADKIADAEQELADKQNALYNIGLEGANDYAEKYAQTMQEMYETLSELHQQYLDGEFASEEEYNNAVAAAKEYYYQKLEDYSSLYKVALTTDSRVIKDAWSTDYNDMMYKVEELKYSVEDYLSESRLVISSWSQDVKLALDESGMSDFGQAVQDVKKASDELNEAITGEDGLLDAMDKQIEAANNVTSAYAEQRKGVQDLITEYEGLIGTVDDYIKKVEESDKIAEQVKTNTNVSAGQSTGIYSNNSSSSSSSSSGGGSGGTSSTQSSGSSANSKVLAIQQYLNRYHSAGLVEDGLWGSNTAHACWLEGWPTSIDGAYEAMLKCAHGGSSSNHGLISNTGLKSQFMYTAYDTGGYTGEWGSYGKLAMLHQKELVLNAGDTENFLASMEVLDHILEIIDLQSASSRLGGLLSSPTVGNSDSVIEQHIEIHAQFPDATDHSEIEEAFNNLINQASQYANRK